MLQALFKKEKNRSMKFLLIPMMLFLVSSCGNSNQDELTALQGELAKATETINELKSQMEPEGELVHLVFFKLKPEANTQELIDEIKKLETISEVKDLEVGPFEDLEDARALDEYGLMMQMSFDDKAAYQVYQSHPTHLALREKAMGFLAGPPVTYDFFKK